MLPIIQQYWSSASETFLVYVELNVHGGVLAEADRLRPRNRGPPVSEVQDPRTGLRQVLQILGRIEPHDVGVELCRTEREVALLALVTAASNQLKGEVFPDWGMSGGEEDLQPLLQDTKAARMAFDKDDFHLMNILANRVMADAVFQHEAQQRFLMTGFFLKDVAIEMLSIAATGKAATTTTGKALVDPYLKQVLSMASTRDFDLQSFWKVYEEYGERIRRVGMDDVEERAYSENKRFMKAAADWMLHYLEAHRHLLLHPRNQLLEGILNEMGRIYRVHGASVRELILLALFTYLQRVYAYVRLVARKPDGSLDPEMVQSEVFPFLDRIVSQFSSVPQPDFEKANSILIDLLIRWREFFIRYTELRPVPGVASERGIELPEETKKKITEAITRSLEKEAERK